MNHNISFSNEEDKEEEEYEVEKIIGKKIKKGNLYYRVKWKNYPISESTWEPMENLTNARKSIVDYESSQIKESKNTLSNGRELTKTIKPKKIEKPHLKLKRERCKSPSMNNKQKAKKLLPFDEYRNEFKDEIEEDDEIKLLSTSKSDNNSSNVNWSLKTQRIKIKSIDNVKFIGNTLYAYVSLYEGGKPKTVKQQLLSTKDVAELDPLKLIQFYESKITFKNK